MYLPEDHELAKALFAERGPAGLISMARMSTGLITSVPRYGGYAAYLPEARRRRLKRDQ